MWFWNVGLYRDDGQIQKHQGTQIGKKQKTHTGRIQRKMLDVIIKCNMKIKNYLNVTINLDNTSYKPN